MRAWSDSWRPPTSASSTRRPTSGPIDTAFRAFERDTAIGGGVFSAAVAFRVFLFLVPFVFFVVVTLGLASEASSESPDELARRIGVTGLMARTFASAATLDAWSRLWAMLISAFAVFLAARALVKVLRISHGLRPGSDRRRRDLAQRSYPVRRWSRSG